MKTYLLAGLLAIAALSGCSKKDDPQVNNGGGSTGTGTTTVTPKSSATNSGSAITVSMGVQDFGDVTDAGGTKVSVTSIQVGLPNGGKAAVKYYLSSTSPVGTVKSVVSRDFNSSLFNNSATGTLTSRTATTAGVSHLYLSGTFTANLGAGYTTVAGTFTDLQAY